MAKVTISAKTYTFSNGTANDATPIDSSFTTLFNNDDMLKTAVNNLEDGNFNETSTLTLNNAYGGSSPTANGIVQVERGTLGNAVLKWNETSDIWQGSNNGLNYFPLLPKNYKDGCVVSYASASTVSIGIGSWNESTNKTIIEVTAPLTLDITSTGTANGTDTTEATSTWYYVYLIMKSSDGTVAGMLSPTNEVISGSITLPSGYDLKRQLPIAIRNDASGNIIPFMVGEGWPQRPKIFYSQAEDAAAYKVINAGQSTSFSSVSCTALVPPISRLATLFGWLNDNGSSGSMTFRDTSASGSGQSVAASTTTGGNQRYEIAITLSSSQAFQYKVSASANQAHCHVKAYVVTEMS